MVSATDYVAMEKTFCTTLSAFPIATKSDDKVYIQVAESMAHEDVRRR